MFGVDKRVRLTNHPRVVESVTLTAGARGNPRKRERGTPAAARRRGNDRDVDYDDGPARATS